MSAPRWHRLGLIGNPAGSAPWAHTHAALPAVYPSGDGRLDLFVSSRDASGRARIGRCHLAMEPVPSVSALEPEPVLDLGPLGAFDDSGVTMSCIVRHEDTSVLYYTGWTRGATVPFYLFIGAALSVDGGQTYRRTSNAPIVERASDDPFLTASPCVAVENGIWRMWYISGTSWERRGDTLRHYYHIKYTESGDGLEWRRSRRAIVDYATPDEHAFARPCVLRDDDMYRMWYSYRGDRYRIGGAESADGIHWVRRDDDMGLSAGDGWEREMVAYPWVFDWHGQRHMVYNGNDYGRTGIGLAVWR